MSEQGQIWGQIRLFRDLSSRVLKISKDGDWTTSPEKVLCAGVSSGWLAPLPIASLTLSYFTLRVLTPSEHCRAEPSSTIPVIPSGVGGMLLSGHPEAVPPGWTSPDPSASPHGTSAPDPSRHGGRSAERTPVCQGCPCLRWEPERGPGIQMCSHECRVTSTNLSFYQKTKQADEALNLVNMTPGKYWFNIDFSKLWGSKIRGPALCITK